jgi:alpha-1,2-glucosyltransferase
MLYIWPFIAFFSFPVIVQAFFSGVSGKITTQKLLQQIPRIWILLTTTAIALFAVHYNTIVHPFTLADNRHYVFYVFRLLRRHWTLKYLVAPIYVVCGVLSIYSSVTLPTGQAAKSTKEYASKKNARLRQRMGLILVWLVTTALALTTAPLVEPRYFIIPWTLWRISVSLDTQTNTSLWLETVWYGVINIVTGYMFLYRPFEWKQEPGQAQRFMW